MVAAADEVIGAVTDSNAAVNSVDENATSGTAVGITAVATDPDSFDTVTYALINDTNGRFDINETTGVVTVSFSGAPLKVTDDTVYDITVQATSSDSSSSTTIMSITVQNSITNEPAGYGVISYGEHQWLDRNLGAASACANVEVAETNSCVGDYYQWGRAKDGHQTIEGVADAIDPARLTTVLSTSENPGHDLFIITDLDYIECESNPCNWIDKNIPALWQVEGNTTNGDNGVCPAGWRVPTKSEFETLGFTDTGSGLTSSDIFAKIRLHTSGYRDDEDGLVTYNIPQDDGFYWTSTITGDGYSYTAWIDSIRVKFANNFGRANGFQIRCVKD